MKKTFDFEPVLFNPEKYDMDTLLEIQEAIAQQLEGTRYLGCQFSEYRWGIMINGIHRDIPGYIYVSTSLLDPQLTNKNEAISDFVSEWEKNDTPESVAGYKNFLKTITSYGRD